MRFKFPPLRATLHWLSGARLPLLATVVAIAALGIALRPGASEPLIRLLGLALQVLGLLTVVAGVVSLRAYFTQPTYSSLLRDWLAECPILIQTYTLKVDSARHAHTGSSATLTHVVPIPDDGPLEARLTAVSRSLAALRHETTTYQAETTAILSALDRTVAALKGEGQQIKSTLERQVETATTGGLHLTLVGTAWLFFGVTLSTAASELSALLR